MGKIFLTEHPELTWLMSFEFHEDGKTKFFDKDPKRYLEKRLHPVQEKLLKDTCEENWLTAIITFGDGNVDNTMGGIFEKIPAYTIARPNASLGLFYKHSSSKIELVFYTRFLTISYGSVTPYTFAERARDESNKLHTTHDNSTRKTIKADLLKNLKELNSVKVIPEITEDWFLKRESRRSHLRIYEFYRIPGGIYVPWIVPKYQRPIRKKYITPRWLFRRNTFHGIHDTWGCWMLLRNFLWLWPNEYRKRKPSTGAESFYTGINKCYLRKKITGQSKDKQRKCIKKVLQADNAPSTPGFTSTTYHKMFDLRERNFAYFEFVRMFSGLKYTHHSNNVKFPKAHIEYEVRENSVSKKEFKTNITIPGDDYLKDEWLKFSSGLTVKIKKYKSFGSVITLYDDLPDFPKKGDKFTIADKLNCWKSPSTKYGRNFFGYEPGSDNKNKKRFWADVYVFKRTDRFTEETGDEDPFK